VDPLVDLKALPDAIAVTGSSRRERKWDRSGR